MFTVFMVLTFFSANSISATEVVNVDQYELADVDGDGCISWEELRNRGVLIFHALDLNADGIVSGEEHPEALNVKGEKISPKSVDQANFQASLRTAFELGDKNKDKCLNRQEWHK